MRRSRLFTSAAIMGVVWVVASPAFAAGPAIVQPTAPFTAPLNAAKTGPASFLVKAGGYAQGTSVKVEVCDGVPATDPQWDPSTDCDLGSSPNALFALADGTVTWDPSKPGQAVNIFDGVSPQNFFNCLYPGQPSPNNGNADFTNCQIKVSTQLAAATTDQAFLTFTLPVPPGAPTTTTTTVVATTTTTVQATTTTSGPGTTTTTSAATTTTTTIPGGTTTTTTTGGTTTTSTTTTTIAGGTTTTSTTNPETGQTTTTTDSGGLALTGVNPRFVAWIGLVLFVLGAIVVGIYRQYHER